jgi:zinc transport system substrate-binding protein
MRKVFFLGVVGCCLVAASIAWAQPIKAFVSIAPQRYFLGRIGGNLVQITVMVEPGVSPHTYEPKPRQMAELAKAKLYFTIGETFERAWLDKIRNVNPALVIVRTEAGIDKIPMATHHHGGEEGHDHGIKDPHIWLSPPLVMLQARNILQGLLRADPVHRDIYQANYKKFIIELVDLDAELTNALEARDRAQAFMVFHPAWGYFALAYGLEQVAVEVEGKEPKPAELQRLIQDARERGIKVVFVQPQFSTKSAETIASAVGGQIAFVDPLSPEWSKNLREVAAKFKGALR